MDLSSKIKRKASEIGFSKVGIAKAEFYKQDQFKIDILEKEKIENEENEKSKHTVKVKMVTNFIDSFTKKYSRRPSVDEMLSNLIDISPYDLRIIMSELGYS